MPNSPKIETPSGIFHVSVNNFGPIKHAAVDLKPLTIFVGKGNTGKTHLATLIYALHNELGGFPRLPYSRLTDINFDGGKKNQHFDELIHFFSTITPQAPLHPNQLSLNVLPSLILDTLITSNTQKPLFPKKITESIASTFGVKKYFDLCRASANPKRFSINFGYTENTQPIWEAKLSSDRDKIKFDSLLNEKAPVHFYSTEEEHSELLQQARELAKNKHIRNKRETDILKSLEEIYPFFLELTSGTTGKAYYLPAARSGLIQSYKLIASSLLNQYPYRESNKPNLTVPLPATTTKLISQLLYLDEWYSRNSKITNGQDPKSSNPIRAAIDNFEKYIIGGKIRMTRELNSAFSNLNFTPTGSKVDFSLSQSGSMVAELAPIVFLIKEYVLPSDLVIIEEPEAHLHASAQVEIANCMARLVRNNVRILVTTHSEWFLKCIENLIYKGDLVNSRNNCDQKLESDFLLRSEVGVWEFINRRRKMGTEVKKIDIHEERGAIPENLVQLNLALYNELASIQDKISMESS